MSFLSLMPIIHIALRAERKKLIKDQEKSLGNAENFLWVVIKGFLCCCI